MAAVRILIWLPDRLVRRSSISNMAFSPWRMFFFSAGVAPAHRRYLDATRSARRTEGVRISNRVEHQQRRLRKLELLRQRAAAPAEMVQSGRTHSDLFRD